MLKSHTYIIGLLCSTVLSQGAMTQEAEDEPLFALEEITVTAQKRSENLQETPIAITALTEMGMKARGMSNISQLSSYSPSLVFDTTAAVSGSSSAAAITIRGVGQTDYSMTTEPGVGVYVDGIYMARSIGGVLDTLDLERVEVLRGPQGTLFGRNTIGGAISLISKKPASEFGGNAEITYGNFNRIDLRASVDAPLSESVRTRLSVSSKNRDGYVKGLLDDREYGNENADSMRFMMDVDLSSSLTAALTFDYSRVREQNAASTLVGVTQMPPGANGEPPSLSFLYNVFDAPVTNIPGFGLNVPYDERWVPEDIDTTYATGPNDGTELDVWGGSLILDWELSDSVSVKSMTAYRKTKGSFTGDPDGSPMVITEMITGPYEHKQFSQELQMTGISLEGRMKWVAGLYYLDEEGLDILDVPLVPVFGSVVNHQVVSGDSKAAYAQATFDLTDRLSATAGIRHTEDNKHFDPINSSLTLGAVGSGVFAGHPALVDDGTPFGSLYFVPVGKISEKFTNTSPKFGLDYRVSNDFFLYASYSKGFKSGGFNVRYLVPREEVLAFDPEKLATYEGGFKWTSADNRIRLNGAVYHSSYSDIQVVVFEQFGAPVTQNAGKAKIDGFELEMTALATENLELEAGLGYINARYTEINDPTAAITGSGAISTDSDLPNAPKWSVNGALTYSIDMPNDGSLAFRTDWSYRSRIENDAQNSPFLSQEAFHKVNLAATYTDPSDQWDLVLFVHNLTDERTIMAGNSNFAIGFHEANFERPRTYGATVRVRF